MGCQGGHLLCAARSLFWGRFFQLGGLNARGVQNRDEARQRDSSERFSACYSRFGADRIVRASNQAERISAMAAVTGPLAFAFSHTFVALLAGLITGFWIDRETAQERLSLLAYE